MPRDFSLTTSLLSVVKSSLGVVCFFSLVPSDRHINVSHDKYDES